MKDFLKLLAFDVALWATIVGGLYFQLPYLYNLAVFIGAIVLFNGRAMTTETKSNTHSRSSS